MSGFEDGSEKPVSLSKHNLRYSEATVFPPLLKLSGQTQTQPDQLPHLTLPRDEASRVDLLLEGDSFTTSLSLWVKNAMLADIPKTLVCMHDSSKVQVTVYRFCCIKQSQALPLARLIDLQRPFVSAVPIMATAVDPSYLSRFIYCGAVFHTSF